MRLEERRPATKPKMKPVLGDLYCGICGIDFKHSSELVRNTEGLAIHLDCIRRERILNLKAQIAAKQNELDAPEPNWNPAPYPTPSWSPPGQSTSKRTAPSDQHWNGYADKKHKHPMHQTTANAHPTGSRAAAEKIPMSTVYTYHPPGPLRQPDLEWHAPMTKRKWEEYVKKESRKDHMGQVATMSHLPQSGSGGGYVKNSTISTGVQIIDICSSDEERPPSAAPLTPKSEKKIRREFQSTSKPLEISSHSQAPIEISGPQPERLSSKSIREPCIEPPLCEEQERLVETILSGRNVFYTGSAGCGKSTVLKNFVKRLKKQKVWKKQDGKDKAARLVPKQVDIVAPTGRAALDINGSTSWTYAGWTPDSMKRPLEELKRAAGYGKWVKKRLMATDVLVIDEISMLENHHFERLNEIMQSARGNSEAFGGVQLIVTGDFCQLPPVRPFQFCFQCGFELLKTHGETVFTCPRQHGSWQESEKWAFCSSAWQAADFVHINLQQIHRQNDTIFIGILQKCRLGVPFSPCEENLLLQHESQTGNAVKLFSTLAEVRSVNREAFNRLRSAAHAFRCNDDFRCYNESLRMKGQRSNFDGTLTALRDHRFEPLIELKQGMVVVLLVNLDQENGLVNGSQGVVMGFEPAEDSSMPRAATKDEKEFAHKSGGMILTGEHADIRAANISKFMEQAAVKVWPRVLFQNRVTRVIYADCRVTELGDVAPYSLISRTQIPLVAGWAMTVHKSQGMTLNRVVVNLSRSFEEGQMYVALSRATSLEGLKVEGLGKQQGCNERVRQFLREKLGMQMP